MWDRRPRLSFPCLGVFCCSLLAAAALANDPWPLERLFSRPYVWGTRPTDPQWSKKGHTLAFLWNAEGGRFRDLYAYHPDTRKLVRLTALEGVRDELNRGAAEKDERRKNYIAPLSGLSGFDLSHDGTQAAFEYRGDLYTVNTAGGAPFRLTHTKAAEMAPQFSPDGKRLAFLRDGQLFVQELTNARLWQITDLENERLSAYAWAPDGTRFLYETRTGSRRQLSLPNYSGRLVITPQFARSLAGDEPLDVHTYVAPVDGGKPVRLENGPWGGKVYAEDALWSPDSKWILERHVHRRQKQQQIIVQDASSGKAKVIHEETDAAWVEPAFAQWSPDSSQILFTGDKDGWSHLYTVAREGGKPRQLTSGPWEIHKEDLFSFDPQWIGDWIYFTSTEVSPAERHFYRVRPDGSGKEKLSHSEGLHVGWVSEDGRYTAMFEAGVKEPLDIYLEGQRVTTSPRPAFREYPWPEVRFVQFPSLGDGKSVAAKLLLPPGYRPEDRRQTPRPAVVFVHGSGYATSVLKQWGSYVDVRSVFNSYLANHGYVVLDLDYRGSSGYGREWRTGIYLYMGGNDLNDVLGGVGYLRGLGNIDTSKLGIWGSSYGGFMANMAMFVAPDAFRAGAAFSAVNDWENYNAHYTEQRLGKPAEYPEAYRRSSPIYYSSGLKNPLLMIHGMIDDNVLFQDVVQLSEKLIQEGKRFEHVYYPEESHQFAREETFIDAFRRTVEFFDRHLN